MSAIRPGIGKIEALINHREIGDDVAFDSLDQRGPVVYRGILDLAPLNPIARPGTYPINDLAPPALYSAHGAASRRNFRDFGPMRPIRQVIQRLAENAEGF